MKPFEARGSGRLGEARGSGTNDASLSCKPKGHWGIDEGDSLA